MAYLKPTGNYGLHIFGLAGRLSTCRGFSGVELRCGNKRSSRAKRIWDGINTAARSKGYKNPNDILTYTDVPGVGVKVIEIIYKSVTGEFLPEEVALSMILEEQNLQRGSLRYGSSGHTLLSSRALKRLVSSRSSDPEMVLSCMHYLKLLSTADLDERQFSSTGVKQAVESIVTVSEADSITTLTGAAGTGKTTTLVNWITQWIESGSLVAAVSFTGKAANNLQVRLDEAISQQLVGQKVSTIHSFVYSQRGPLILDYLVVDEASMVGTELLGWLMKYVGDKTKLILCGDHNQLEPVMAGSPFLDILQTNCDGTDLTKIHRTDNMELVNLYQEVLRGEEYIESDMIHNHDNLDSVLTYVRGKKGKTQWIAYRNATVDAINHTLWQCYTSRRWDAINNDVYRYHYKGLPVVFLKNDRKLGVQNGTSGTVMKYDKYGITISLDHEDRAVFIGNSVDLIKLAFAITVHKSQGSEYDDVCFVTEGGEDRRLIYTAVTRAKKTLEIHNTGKYAGIEIADNDSRRTLLSRRLIRK